MVTIVSILSIATNITLEPSICRILLSFSIANLIGCGMLVYDTAQIICLESHHSVGFIVTITALLSLTHVMLLTLAEYIILTCRSEKKAGNYNGLIFLSWMISISGGSIDVVTTNHVAKSIFVVLFLTAIFFIFVKYYVIIRLHIKKGKLRRTYETFLRGSSLRRKVRKKYWKLKYFGMIIYSYVVFSLPWLVNELREGLREGLYGKEHEDTSLSHSITLIVYSFNFYTPSIICIYLRYQQWRSKKRADIHERPSSYRYRDTFSTSSRHQSIG